MRKNLPYVRPSCKVEYGNYTRVINLRHCEILTKVNKLCAAFFSPMGDKKPFMEYPSFHDQFFFFLLILSGVF